MEELLLNREDDAGLDFCTGLIQETRVGLTSFQGAWLLWGEKREIKADGEILNPLPLEYQSAFLLMA